MQLNEEAVSSLSDGGSAVAAASLLLLEEGDSEQGEPKSFSVTRSCEASGDNIVVSIDKSMEHSVERVSA